MNELKRKLFIIITSILSIIIVLITIIFNISSYYTEYENINDKADLIYDTLNSFNFSNARFIDDDAYIITYSHDGSIKNIYNFTTNIITETDITNIISEHKNNSLYLTKYIFKYKNNNLVIISNLKTKTVLNETLLRSIIIFILSELAIIYLCNKITNYIVKPVEESFNKQKQFIYDASHELKTPIAIIGASVETLENDNDPKWLNNIKEENSRMSDLVKKLLDLSKSENIKENEEFKKVNISRIIENKALSFESLMFENNLELNCNIDKDINFNCNSDRIKELVSILIDNAIKYSDKNSVITVNLYKDKNITLEVVNKGKEIPKEDQDKIFDRFYKVDKSRNRNNSYGLGLSIAKNIVNNHNGIIKVDSSNNITKFTVIFKEN